MDEKESCLTCIGTGFRSEGRCPDCSGREEVSWAHFVLQRTCVIIFFLASIQLGGRSAVRNEFESGFQSPENALSPEIAWIALSLIAFGWGGKVLAYLW